MTRCQICSKPHGTACVDVKFHTAGPADGTVLRGHIACLLRYPEPEPTPAPLPDLVIVDWDDLGWRAICRIHGDVGLKAFKDDAHLAAAHHLARKHSLEDQLAASLERLGVESMR